MESATKASELNELLLDIDWTVANSESSEEFRMLLPLGYQFHADVLRALNRNEEAVLMFPQDLNETAVASAYEAAVNTPPLNISRKDSTSCFIVTMNLLLFFVMKFIERSILKWCTSWYIISRCFH